MDDEAKQLLREIRDAILRQESSVKRFKRALVVIIAVLLCVVAVLMIQLERLMTEPEQVPAPAASQK
jgi:hypothetical protein